MNLITRIKRRGLGFLFQAITAAIAVVSLLIYIVYIICGGKADAVVFIGLVLAIGAVIALFFYDKVFSDLIALVPAVLYALSFALVLKNGVGNIADAVSNIVMFGIKEVAVFDYILAILLFIAFILAIVACFIKRNKEDTVAE